VSSHQATSVCWAPSAYHYKVSLWLSSSSFLLRRLNQFVCFFSRCRFDSACERYASAGMPSSSRFARVARLEAALMSIQTSTSLKRMGLMDNASVAYQVGARPPLLCTHAQLQSDTSFPSVCYFQRRPHQMLPLLAAHLPAYSSI
jgi:hypothetical protein